MAEKQQEEKEMHDRKLKEVDVLNAQIIACQQETTSYNNAFISSASVCAIITAAGGLMTESADSNVGILLYFIPLIYLLMVYNIIKYTGFQIQLGSYRRQLEKRLNELLLEENLFGLIEKKTVNNPFFIMCGFGVALFVIPAFVLLMIWVVNAPDEYGIKTCFVIIYAIEILICLIQTFLLLKMFSADKDGSGKKKKSKNKKNK